MGFTESLAPGEQGKGVYREGDRSVKDRLSFVIALVLLAADAS